MSTAVSLGAPQGDEQCQQAVGAWQVSQGHHEMIERLRSVVACSGRMLLMGVPTGPDFETSRLPCCRLGCALTPTYLSRTLARMLRR